MSMQCCRDLPIRIVLQHPQTWGIPFSPRTAASCTPLRFPAPMPWQLTPALLESRLPQATHYRHTVGSRYCSSLTTALSGLLLGSCKITFGRGKNVFCYYFYDLFMTQLSSVITLKLFGHGKCLFCDKIRGTAFNGKYMLSKIFVIFYFCGGISWPSIWNYVVILKFLFNQSLHLWSHNIVVSSLQPIYLLRSSLKLDD